MRSYRGCAGAYPDKPVSLQLYCGTSASLICATNVHVGLVERVMLLFLCYIFLGFYCQAVSCRLLENMKDQ